jgi:hypothetical protein
METETEKLFNELKAMYNFMKTQKDIYKFKNETIVKLNNQLKIKMCQLKEKPDLSEEINKTIKEIENDIYNGHNRIETLKLFNEPYDDFNDIFPLKDIEYLKTKIKDIVEFNKLSASNSIIFKAKYEDKPCFIKAFFDEPNLLYEQKMYRYIKNRKEQLKPYYEDYFIKLYDTFKITNKDFYVFFGEKIIYNEQLLSSEYKNENINLIITEDIGGTNFKKYYIKNILNSQKIINTLFHLIYIIYLMNNKLKFIHNDCHFGNIIIKELEEDYECNYEIENSEYVKNINYRICFYDFDRSYLYNKNNDSLPMPLTTKKINYYVQNKISARDIWTIVNSLLYELHKGNISNPIPPPILQSFEDDDDDYDYNFSSHIKESTINFIFDKNIFNDHNIFITFNAETYHKENYYNKDTRYLKILIKIILNNNPLYVDKLKSLFLNTLEGTTYWNLYCENFTDSNCVIPDDKDLYPLEVLYRLLKNEYIFEILNFTKINPFYKKYLKYKTKYLLQKNKY